jgi:hypothetical protein
VIVTADSWPRISCAIGGGTFLSIASLFPKACRSQWGALSRTRQADALLVGIVEATSRNAALAFSIVDDQILVRQVVVKDEATCGAR